MRIIFKKLKANTYLPTFSSFPSDQLEDSDGLCACIHVHTDPLHNCRREPNFISTARCTELKKQTISVHNPILLSTTPAVFIGHLPSQHNNVTFTVPHSLYCTIQEETNTLLKQLGTVWLLHNAIWVTGFLFTKL